LPSLRSLNMISVPHGGKLVNTMVKSDQEKKNLIAACNFDLELDERQLCDVELLMQGGFSPLDGYMDEANYQSVVNDMKLTNGLIFGLPIVFDTNDSRVKPGAKILLKYKDTPIAIFDVSSRYLAKKPLEAKKCYGTTSIEHPAVYMITAERGIYYCGGKITGLNVPTREFLCKSPEEVRESLPKDVDIVAFQCRNPIHRAHYELFTRALDDPIVGKDGVVLVHPTCGPTQPDDIPGTVRYKTYEVLKEQTKNPRIVWAYLPYSMHMAGPREAIQHMIIRKNYGCTHFIIGRDMAGCKSSLTGDDFYGAYDAQDFAKANAEAVGVKPVPSLNLVYTEEESYVTAEYAKEKGLTVKNLSGTKFRQMLRSGDEIPNWFAFESVVKVLREEAMAAPK
jgi:sulfate adenylyltransferase